MTTVRHSRVGRKIRMPDAGQLPPLGLGRTLPDRGGGVRIPAYPPPEHCRPCATRGRFPIPSSAGGYSSIPKRGYAKHSAKLPACRKPVLKLQTGQTQSNRDAADILSEASRFCVYSVRRRMIIILLLPCFNDKIYIYLK